MIVVTSDKGELIKKLNATRTGNGTYSATFAGLPEGRFQVNFSVRQPLAISDLSRATSLALAVEPEWKRYQYLLLVVIILALLAGLVLFRLRRRRSQ